MKLKTKLLLGFTMILVIMAVLFGVSIQNLDLANKNVETNQQVRYPRSHITEHFNSFSSPYC